MCETHKNVGFLLKRKSKDDKGSMRVIAMMMKASKRKQKRSKARKAGMIIINHASINADS